MKSQTFGSGPVKRFLMKSQNLEAET